MKDSDRKATSHIVAKLEEGSANRNEIVALLIYLREQLDRNDPLKDIAHCIAHNNRDRGFAFDYVTSFVDHFLEIVSSGGVLHVRVLFPLSDLVESLILVLEAQNISVDGQALRGHMKELHTLLSSILADTTIDIKHSKVRRCQFLQENDGVRDRLSCVIYFNQTIQGIITIPSDIGTGFPVLE